MSLNIKEESKRLQDAQKILSKLSEQEKIVNQKKSAWEKEETKLEDMKTEYLRLTDRKEVTTVQPKEEKKEVQPQEEQPKN